MLGRSGEWGDHVTLQAAADNVSAAISNSLLLLLDATIDYYFYSFFLKYLEFFFSNWAEKVQFD